VIFLSESRLQQLFLPPDDRVILERQQDEEHRDEPQEPGADGETDPQRNIAQVQRIADDRKRAGGYERTEAVASRARDDADMVHGPQTQRFGPDHARDAEDDELARAAGIVGRDEQQGEHEGDRD
jgi:hypothetical protein